MKLNTESKVIKINEQLNYEWIFIYDKEKLSTELNKPSNAHKECKLEWCFLTFELAMIQLLKQTTSQTESIGHLGRDKRLGFSIGDLKRLLERDNSFGLEIKPRTLRKRMKEKFEETNYFLFDIFEKVSPTNNMSFFYYRSNQVINITNKVKSLLSTSSIDSLVISKMQTTLDKLNEIIKAQNNEKSYAHNNDNAENNNNISQLIEPILAVAEVVEPSVIGNYQMQTWAQEKANLLGVITDLSQQLASSQERVTDLVKTVADREEEIDSLKKEVEELKKRKSDQIQTKSQAEAKKPYNPRFEYSSSSTTEYFAEPDAPASKGQQMDG